MDRIKIPFAALNAKVSLRRNRTPHAQSFGHELNVAQKVDAGAGELEFPFQLLDYKNENKKVKSKMMTHRDAYEKNQLLKGSSFAWAKCQSL